MQGMLHSTNNPPIVHHWPSMGLFMAFAFTHLLSEIQIKVLLVLGAGVLSSRAVEDIL
jgi:hypothetical protein